MGVSYLQLFDLRPLNPLNSSPEYKSPFFWDTLYILLYLFNIYFIWITMCHLGLAGDLSVYFWFRLPVPQKYYTTISGDGNYSIGGIQYKNSEEKKQCRNWEVRPEAWNHLNREGKYNYREWHKTYLMCQSREKGKGDTWFEFLQAKSLTEMDIWVHFCCWIRHQNSNLRSSQMTLSF